MNFIWSLKGVNLTGIIIFVIYYAVTIGKCNEDLDLEPEDPLPEPEKDYQGFKVLRLNVDTNETLKALNDLQRDGSYDFWKEPMLESHADLMVSPNQIEKVDKLIDDLHIKHEIMFSNLKPAISSEKRISVNRIGNKMDWTSYQRLETIYHWMDSLVKNHTVNESMTMISVETIGYSFEKRPIKVLKISKNWSQINGVNRSAVWIDGGIHAREWIAPATTSYIANKIIEGNLRGELWTSMFDWYIAPVINPDGYEYSHTTDRLWRKTRSYPRQGSSIIDTLVNLCVGADPNRNWDYKWGGMGGSINPCAQNYRGRESSSEAEVKAVQDFIMSKKDQFKLYTTFHSYSQVILLPWGHSYEYVDDYDELMRVAQNGAKKLEKVHGTHYRAGATPHILYPAAGGSHDWAKGAAGIKYSYTVELPDRGFYGFLLPASRIIPVGDETLELVKSMAEDMIDIYYY